MIRTPNTFLNSMFQRTIRTKWPWCFMWTEPPFLCTLLYFFQYETLLYSMTLRADFTILSFLIRMAELLIFRLCWHFELCEIQWGYKYFLAKPWTPSGTGKGVNQEVPPQQARATWALPHNSMWNGARVGVTAIFLPFSINAVEIIASLTSEFKQLSSSSCCCLHLQSKSILTSHFLQAESQVRGQWDTFP